MGDLFYVKHTKTLNFSLVAEALAGLIYHSPSDENSNFQFTPGLMMGEVSKRRRKTL